MKGSECYGYRGSNYYIAVLKFQPNTALRQPAYLTLPNRYLRYLTLLYKPLFELSRCLHFGAGTSDGRTVN